MYKIAGSIMLVMLVLFLVLGGLPQPGTIDWQNQDWTYSGQEDGALRFTAETGISFIVQIKELGSYIVNFREQEYNLTLNQGQINIIFPDGRQLRAAAVGSNSDIKVEIIDDPIPSEELPLFYLALEVDRVNRPHTTRLVIGVLIVIYGAVSILKPRRFAQTTAYFKRYMMVGKVKPTEYNVKVTSIMGGFFMVAGWLIVLMSIWKVF